MQTTPQTTPPDVVADLDLLVRDVVHVDEFLDGLATIAARVAPAGFSVIVTIRRGGFLFTARDAPASWDVRLGVDAIQEDEAIWTADLDADARTRGAGTSMSLPLHGGPDVVGSLTFYAHEPRGFDDGIAQTAATFAEHASQALHDVVRRAAASARATRDGTG